MPNTVYSRLPRPAIERFWEKVRKTDDCWLWVAGTTKAGYGMFHPSHGVSAYAHRYSWELEHGPIPAGMHVCHHCDTPPCVRPDHLFLGSEADNLADMVRKGRHHGNTWHDRMPERVARGERHGGAKLKVSDVLDIRARLAAGEQTTEVARLYGISHSSISMIGSRKHWKHL